MLVQTYVPYSNKRKWQSWYPLVCSSLINLCYACYAARSRLFAMCCKLPRLSNYKPRYLNYSTRANECPWYYKHSTCIGPTYQLHWCWHNQSYLVLSTLTISTRIRLMERASQCSDGMGTGIPVKSWAAKVLPITVPGTRFTGFPRDGSVICLGLSAGIYQTLGLKCL